LRNLYPTPYEWPGGYNLSVCGPSIAGGFQDFFDAHWREFDVDGEALAASFLRPYLMMITADLCVQPGDEHRLEWTPLFRYGGWG
jgi:hypothetical protein